jgi:hypothetical protein
MDVHAESMAAVCPMPHAMLMICFISANPAAVDYQQQKRFDGDKNRVLVRGRIMSADIRDLFDKHKVPGRCGLRIDKSPKSCKGMERLDKTIQGYLLELCFVVYWIVYPVGVYPIQVAEKALSAVWGVSPVERTAA